MCPTIVPLMRETKKEQDIYFTSLIETMKILVATEKPFAKKAVDGIRKIVEDAGYELALLEKYTDKGQLLEAVADVDAVILLVEPIANVGPQEQELIEKIREAKVPAILVINKIDTVEKETLLPVIAAYKDLLDFTDVIPISAKGHDGLDSLMQVCEGFAQPGPFMFPEGISTDMPEKQVMAEIIREKLLWNLEKEIPHGTAVEITKFSERDDGIIDLDATIYCEKASHKGIIIGKNGQMLKKISSDARKDCERFMGTKVFLQTWVRVKENWRDSDFMISNFGYHKD